MKTQEQYEIFKRLAEHHISNDYAAVKIGCTRRHINRLLLKYNTDGEAGFVHANTGRKPIHTLTDLQKNDIISIYNNKYWDTNFIAVNCLNT